VASARFNACAPAVYRRRRLALAGDMQQDPRMGVQHGRRQPACQLGEFIESEAFGFPRAHRGEQRRCVTRSPGSDQQPDGKVGAAFSRPPGATAPAGIARLAGDGLGCLSIMRNDS